MSRTSSSLDCTVNLVRTADESIAKQQPKDDASWEMHFTAGTYGVLMTKIQKCFILSGFNEEAECVGGSLDQIKSLTFKNASSHTA